MLTAIVTATYKNTKIVVQCYLTTKFTNLLAEIGWDGWITYGLENDSSLASFHVSNSLSLFVMPAEY